MAAHRNSLGVKPTTASQMPLEHVAIKAHRSKDIVLKIDIETFKDRFYMK